MKRLKLPSSPFSWEFGRKYHNVSPLSPSSKSGILSYFRHYLNIVMLWSVWTQFDLMPCVLC